jgi:DNA-binding NarL/FixJ family response regulator
MDAGDLSETRERIEPLLAPDVPPDARARALLLRAETEHLDRRLLVRCLKEAIEVAEDPNIRCWAWMRYAQHGGWLSGDARVAVESALEALRLAELTGDRPLITAAKSVLAYFGGACGQRDTKFADDDLVGLEQLPSTAIWVITPPTTLGSLLLWAGELDRARDVLLREHEHLLRQGKLLRLPFVLLIALADVEWRAGRWAEAQARADEAQSILEDAVHGGTTNVYYVRVLLTGSRGQLAEARALAAEGLHLTELRTDHLNPLRIRWALGHVELAAGDPAAALQSLEGLPQALGEFGISEPGWQPILPDVVESLVSVGRVEEAEAILQQLEQQAAALEHRWATPAALRCRALLLLAHERADEAAEAADRAAAAFAELGFPLDHARSLLAAGAARRRAGQRREAADSLRSAIEILEELGAALWLEQARDELRRASPRPRRDRELTGAERRVAALVAQGQTNREVAAQLFTTVTTVEAHLTRIYRKLGMRSRTQLARAVADVSLQLD